MNDLIPEKVFGFMTDNGMLRPGDEYLVALSGGADSCCLLSVLSELSHKADIRVRAAHLNHMIRGDAAYADEAFCVRLCESLGVELTVKRIDVPAVASGRRESLELCARNERYAFLRETARGGRIATGHTMNDNAETVLLALTRGSGLRGASGIPPVNGDIVRPILCLTRSETESYCRETGISFVTDASNMSTEYSRNRIRLKCLPELENVNPATVGNIFRFSETAREEDCFLDSLARKELNKALADGKLAVDKIKDVDRVVRKRVVRLYLASFPGIDPEKRHIDSISDEMFKRFRLDLPGGAAVVSDGSVVSVDFGCADSISGWEIPISSDAGLYQTPFCSVRITRITQEDYFLQKKSKNLYTYFLNGDKIRFNSVLRGRIAGDRLHSARRGLTKTVGRLMTEAKMSVSEREKVVVLSCAGAVVCVCPFGTDAAFEPDSGTNEIIKAEFCYNDQ